MKNAVVVYTFLPYSELLNVNAKITVRGLQETRVSMFNLQLSVSNPKCNKTH
jgi:hypothetical protein